MTFKQLDKDAIQVIREEMVRSKINNCASGWYEYEGEMYELVLVLRKDKLAGKNLTQTSTKDKQSTNTPKGDHKENAQ